MAEHAMTFGETPTSGDKLWGLLAQLSPYVAPFIGPVVALVLFNTRSAFVRYHAIQALAMQVLILVLGAAISVVSVLTCGIGGILYVALLPFVLAPLYGAWLAWEGRWDGFPGLSSFGR
jgi:uncharacterized membrane protein